jgi:Ferric reductase NAD binding domain
MIGSLSWFAKELEELQASPVINLIVHVTRAPGPSTLSLADFNDSRSTSSAATQTCNSPSVGDDEKISDSYPEKGSFPSPRIASTTNLASTTASIHDPEKLECGTEYPTFPSTPDSQSLSLLSGRPNTKALIQECVAGMDSDRCNGKNRVIIAVCGPETLVTDVRNTVAELIKDSASSGPAFELHCEQFGW